ncbi:MAG: TIGR03620 family F420-dependent LLM class oxidoreductase [Planctomycetaceae bacterium]
MTGDHDALRARLGRVGAWTFAFDARPAAQVAIDARGIETLGYPALWVPEGGGSRDVIGHLSWLLEATETLTVASGIANITARQPDVLQAGATLLADAHGDRVVLGIGVGHEYTTERRGVAWDRPLERMRAYLDAMDAVAGTWPAPAVAPRRLLAALADGMLRLSAERALGAHTYFVPPEHTAHARAVLGPEPVLAVEQTVVLQTDPASARAIARAWTVHYLELPNYARNWARLGFAEELDDGGSDRLVDAAVAWGDVEAVAARVRAHLDAGADHVCVQVISNDDADVCVPQLRELAPALLAG